MAFTRERRDTKSWSSRSAKRHLPSSWNHLNEHTISKYDRDALALGQNDTGERDHVFVAHRVTNNRERFLTYSSFGTR